MTGIEEDIFESFFAELNQDDEIPKKLVEELRKLWKSGEIASKEIILSIIEKGVENGSNGQDN